MTTIGQPVTIRADHREPEGIVKALRAIDGVTVLVEQMECGDFEIAPGVFVERKGTNDFGQSIIDRRLFTQVKEARDSGKELIFLIEGDPFRGQRMLHENAVSGAISYLIAVERLSVVQAPTCQLAARLIADLARHRQLGLGYEVNLREARPKDPRQAQLYLLQGLPGIGPGKARALLNHFGSVRRVMAASAVDIAQVPGFGVKAAQTLTAALDQV